MKRILIVFLAILLCVSLANAIDQPNMTAARNDLNKAESSLRKATGDKGGHRTRAINLISQAIAEINRGIEYDRATPGDGGGGNNRRRPRRRPSSDFDASNFSTSSKSSDQPKMQEARSHLQDALNHLQRATADKGGHRARAIELTREAIGEVNKGIAFDRSN